MRWTVEALFSLTVGGTYSELPGVVVAPGGSDVRVILGKSTLLVDNDIIILGGKIDSSEGACSINLPDKKELRDLLNRLI